MIKPVNNNLIIELHVPNFEIVKSFYSDLGFQITLDDLPNEKELGYLTMTCEDVPGNIILNFYGDDERAFNQSYLNNFLRIQKEDLQ